MADITPPGDGIPAWLIALGGAVTSLAGWQVWKPIGRWVAKRLEVQQQLVVGERTNYMSQMIAELRVARDEMVELRKDLGEEKELRMALSVEIAVLTERNVTMTKLMADDKKECQAAIRGLRDQIKRLHGLG